MGTGNSTGGYGYRIMRKNQSRKVGDLEILFDFVISINGQDITYNNDERKKNFKDWLNAHNNDTELELGIYNARNRTVRRVQIPIFQQSKLGLTVRYQPFSRVYEEGLQVLEVFEGGPSWNRLRNDKSDYILAAGDSSITFTFLSDLENYINHHKASMSDDVPLTLLVFNWKTQKIREVNFILKSWKGGFGLMGIELGSGPRHRIPFHLIWNKEVDEDSDSNSDSNSESNSESNFEKASLLEPPKKPRLIDDSKLIIINKKEDLIEIEKILKNLTLSRNYPKWFKLNEGESSFKKWSFSELFSSEEAQEEELISSYKIWGGVNKSQTYSVPVDPQ